MVLAPSGFPSGCLAFLQLPRHSQLWHLHPSLASAMEPCGLRCILSIETLASIVARVSSVKLSDLNMEQTLVSATVCSCCWRRQGFSCVCCLYGLQSHQTWLGLCICGLCYAQKTESVGFLSHVECSMMSTLVYLTETVDYFRTDFISRTKDPLVCNSLQFLVHVHLCHLLFCTISHIYHIL